MSTDYDEYNMLDPYEVDVESAQEILIEIQSILWRDDDGKTVIDKEWTNVTLEKIARALKPFEPTKRTMTPMRVVKFTVSVITPADDIVNASDLGELLIMSGLRKKQSVKDDYVAFARLDSDHPITEDETRVLLPQLGYAKNYFDKE